MTDRARDARRIQRDIAALTRAYLHAAILSVFRIFSVRETGPATIEEEGDNLHMNVLHAGVIGWRKSDKWSIIWVFI